MYRICNLSTCETVLARFACSRTKIAKIVPANLVFCLRIGKSKFYKTPRKCISPDKGTALILLPSSNNSISSEVHENCL